MPTRLLTIAFRLAMKTALTGTLFFYMAVPAAGELLQLKCTGEGTATEDRGSFGTAEDRINTIDKYVKIDLQTNKLEDEGLIYDCSNDDYEIRCNYQITNKGWDRYMKNYTLLYKGSHIISRLNGRWTYTFEQVYFDGHGNLTLKSKLTGTLFKIFGLCEETKLIKKF